jgi:hypothetical protein
MTVRAFSSALTAALLVTPSPSVGSPEGRLVSLEQAKSLAYAALTPSERRLGADFGGSETRPQERYLYVTLVPSRGEGFLNFAVDRRTGDVWSAASSCLEITNSHLRRLQVELRHQLGISGSDYAKLRTHGPLCER